MHAAIFTYARPYSDKAAAAARLRITVQRARKVPMPFLSARIRAGAK